MVALEDIPVVAEGQIEEPIWNDYFENAEDLYDGFVPDVMID